MPPSVRAITAEWRLYTEEVRLSQGVRLGAHVVDPDPVLFVGCLEDRAPEGYPARCV